MKINCNIFPDKRSIGTHFRFRMQLTWSEKGKQTKKEVSTSFSLPKVDFDFKRGIVKGTSLEATTIRDRIFKVRDFASRLDLPTQLENVDAVRNYLGIATAGDDTIRLVKLTDFIKQFITLNEKKYSYHTIRKYRTLIRNLELFCEKLSLSDAFQVMSKDKQTVFFSNYVDFLLYDTIDKIKKKYENSSVKEDFKLLSSVQATFTETGIKVRLSDFAAHLKEGPTQGTFCTIEELMDIYRTSRSTELPIQEEKAVDLFLFQSFTGLRYNELFHVDSPSITHKMVGSQAFKVLNMVGDKEGEGNTVPLNKICLEILDKWSKREYRAPEYKNHTTKKKEIFTECLLPVMALSQTNKHLHLFFAKVPSLQKTDKRIRYRGSERIEENMPRYMNITSHSARHSYSSYLMSNGLSMDEAGRLLNHASTETTNKHYKHIIEDKLQLKAYEALNAVG